MVRATLPLLLPVERFAAPGVGPQLLPVTGYLPERYLITWRAPASRLRALVPAPLEVDAKDGEGFVSACAVEIREMGVLHTPRFLRFRNVELLYRVSARLDGEPTFYTLRSFVSAPALALLGRFFSHYRPVLSPMTLARTEETFAIDSPEGSVCLERRGDPARPRSSCFGSAEEASAFLVGMGFSAGVRRSGRVQVQAIEHTPWSPRFTTARRARSAYLESLGVPLVHDSTLVMEDIRQVWRATRCRT